MSFYLPKDESVLTKSTAVALSKDVPLSPIATGSPRPERLAVIDGRLRSFNSEARHLVMNWLGVMALTARPLRYRGCALSGSTPPHPQPTPPAPSIPVSARPYSRISRPATRPYVGRGVRPGRECVGGFWRICGGIGAASVRRSRGWAWFRPCVGLKCGSSANWPMDRIGATGRRSSSAIIRIASSSFGSDCSHSSIMTRRASAF